MQAFTRLFRPLPGSSGKCTVQCRSLPSSDTSRRKYGSTLRPTPKLQWAELYYASTLARWSGLCYKPADQLADAVKAEGLEMVAHGHTKYTSWWIADGSVEEHLRHFLDMYEHPSRRTTSAPPSQSQNGHMDHNGNGSSSRNEPSHSSHNSNGHSKSSSSRDHHPLPMHTHHSQPQNGHSPPQHAPNHASSTTSSSCSSQDDPGSACHTPSQRRRFVFIRGVHWAAPDADTRATLTTLGRFWPSPFAPTLTTPQGALVAHSGVAELAADLYDQLKEHLQPADGPVNGAPAAAEHASNTPQNSTTSQASQAQTGALSHSLSQSQSHPVSQAGSVDTPSAANPCHASPLTIAFAGHSLGGALGSLVLALSALNGLRPPSQLTLHTFGSPPVLSHNDGGGGHRVLQVLGLPDSAVHSFVLEHDPVPRALITADPAFNALKQYGPVRQLLQVRSWLHAASGFASGLFGSGDGADSTAVITKDRFMFENVGNVYLLKAGSDVVPIGTPADAEELLRMAFAEVLSQPGRILQAWMDHHHASYAHDLEAAALVDLRRQLRAARDRSLGPHMKSTASGR